MLSTKIDHRPYLSKANVKIFLKITEFTNTNTEIHILS